MAIGNNGGGSPNHDFSPTLPTIDRDKVFWIQKLPVEIAEIAANCAN